MRVAASRLSSVLAMVILASAATAHAASAPHLRRQGTAEQLIVDDKPFLILGGELANSSASSLDPAAEPLARGYELLRHSRP